MSHFSPRQFVFTLMLISLLPQGTPAAGTQEALKLKPPVEQTHVSDKELKVFVKAYVETQKIRLAHEVALKNSREPEETQKIQREANEKLEKSLKEQGLTVKSYNRIFAAVNGNDELRKKTLKLIEQERKSP